MDLETLEKANDLKFSIDFFENILERIGDYKPLGNELKIVPTLGASIDLRIIIGDTLYLKIMDDIVATIKEQKRKAERDLAKL